MTLSSIAQKSTGWAARWWLGDLVLKELFTQYKESVTDDIPYHITPIASVTVHNHNYRQVLYTGATLQLVIMSIPPGAEIGEEVHEDGDQFIRVEAGSVDVDVAGKKFTLMTNEAVVVKAGTVHNVTNVGIDDAKLSILYSPPEHDPDTVQRVIGDGDEL